MCHTVFSDGYFLECSCLELRRMLMGIKIIKLGRNREVIPFYQSSKPYKIHELKSGFKVVGGENIQPLLFLLNIFNPDKLILGDGSESSKIGISYKNDIIAGFHISHFDLDYIGYISPHDDKYATTITPVFSRSEILFYDGNSISVSSFIIPRPDLLHHEIGRMEKIINKNVKQYSLDSFIEEYNKFYIKLGEYYG